MRHTNRHGAARLVSAAMALAMLLGVCTAASRLHPCVNEPDATPQAQARVIRPVSAAALESAAYPARSARTRRPNCYNILLSGQDRSGGGSDTNLLVRIDVPARRIDAVSLPRDTLLHRERYSNRLNYAYASGGTELLRSEVENLLGVPVDYCVSVDLDGFIALVDHIGGVELDIPVDMDYDDPAQDLHIHYKSGVRRLSGQQAMEVVRWRKNNDGSSYPDADIGRIRTQQAFIRAAAAQALRLRNLPALARVALACVKTDLTAGNLVWLGAQAAEIGTDNLSFYTLPGDGSLRYRGESVYVLDPAATLALVNEALDPYDAPISAEELDILVP